MFGIGLDKLMLIDGNKLLEDRKTAAEEPVKSPTLTFFVRF